jgi:hypothetical protein
MFKGFSYILTRYGVVSGRKMIFSKVDGSASSLQSLSTDKWDCRCLQAI